MSSITFSAPFGNPSFHEMCKIDFSDNLGNKDKTGKFEHPPLFTGKVSKNVLLQPEHCRKIPILHISCPSFEEISKTFLDDPTQVFAKVLPKWAWCFVAEFFTFFKIDASRGSKVLYDTLGDDFLGSISSDFFSAYLKYKRETETLFQFCCTDTDDTKP
jgi:hypothetical protein